MSHVSFDSYETSQYVLYKTENQDAKGGAVDLYNSSAYIKLKFYDKNVELNEKGAEKVYVNTYSNNGLTASYNIGEGYPQYNIYEYEIFATYNNVNYFIEYMGSAENPIDFFNSFFN